MKPREGVTRVLILDDEDYRHDVLGKRYKAQGAVTYHAWDLGEFKEKLRRIGKFDVISFDHDIGERETGLEAADYLVSLGKHYAPDLCIVHSWNPIGAQYIFNTLLSAGLNARVERFTAP